jgi:hypothetical protein
VSPLGFATSNPVGRLSRNSTPDNAVPPFGLLTVNVRLVVPFTSTESAPNDLERFGGPTTVMSSKPSPRAVPDSVAMTDAVFGWSPGSSPLTSIEKLQDEFAARLNPFKEMVLIPRNGVPPQEFVDKSGAPIASPCTRVSVTFTPEKLTVWYGLVTVTVKLVVPPTGIDVAPNALVTVGGPTIVMVACAVFPVPNSVDVTASDVLVQTPAVCPNTLNVNWHDELADTVPPRRRMF